MKYENTIIPMSQMYKQRHSSKATFSKVTCSWVLASRSSCNTYHQTFKKMNLVDRALSESWSLGITAQTLSCNLLSCNCLQKSGSCLKHLGIFPSATLWRQMTNHWFIFMLSMGMYELAKHLFKWKAIKKVWFLEDPLWIWPVVK